MNLYNIIIFILGAYLLGSIHFGLIVGKTKGIDIRKDGSGNVGTTNVFRLLGKGWGTVVFICDTLKGWIPVFLALHLTGSVTLAVLTAGAVILGHTFSVFLKFKGGKGVATGLGTIISLMPLLAAIVFIEFFVIFYLGRIVSLASLSAIGTLLVLVFATKQPLALEIFVSLSTLLIFYAHRSNIVRLFKGTENKFGKARRTT